jgi:hypothetical protein
LFWTERADQQAFLQGMGQIQKAMEVYEKAMDIAPDNDEAKQGGHFFSRDLDPTFDRI